MKRFEDKAILVTGAGSGIGAACVQRLFAEGASIAAADVRKEGLDEVVSELGSSDRIYGAGVDVSNRDQVAAFVSGAVGRFGKLDGLVNSAGIRGVGNVLDTDPEVWRKVLPRAFSKPTGAGCHRSTTRSTAGLTTSATAHC